MEKGFNIISQNRKILSHILNNTPHKQLFEIPEGYRNNVWWNIAHVVVTQQLLIYKLSNVKMLIDDHLVQKYRKGTAPVATPSEKEIEEIAGLLRTTSTTVQKDYRNNIFKEYVEYTTSNKVTLKTVEDALSFNIFHEGLHLGVILSLLKVVGQKEATKT